METTPRKFATLPIPKMENIAQDYVNMRQRSINPKNKKPYSPGTIDNELGAIMSWAKWNRKKFERKIKIANVNSTPTLDEELIPPFDVLGRVLYADSTNLRTRVSIALMAFTGCRPEVQGDFLGQDGLKMKDLPELKIENRTVEFEKIPTMIVVRDNFSKSRRQYFSFLPVEGCELLKEYLERRILSGEALSLGTPVIATSEEGAH